MRSSLACGAAGLAQADPALDAAIDTVAPGVPKWATVCVVREHSGRGLEFAWHDYRDTGNRTDFWPASAVKLYAIVGALELLHEHQLPLDTIAAFAHRTPEDTWQPDGARTVREMIGEVFRRSSNEDYTLLLRMTGLDRLNTRLLVAERGFPRSALMRGYVKDLPAEYVREQAQRVSLHAPDADKPVVIEHRWSGRSYSAERGATVLDPQTGNVTSPRELADCLRRILFHEQIPEAERFHLSTRQIAFLRDGGGGWPGLACREPASGPNAWTNALQTLWPDARFFHKSGVISDHALEVACLDARASGGPCFLLVPVIRAGHATRPVPGEPLVGRMSLAIGRWLQARTR